MRFESLVAESPLGSAVMPLGAVLLRPVTRAARRHLDRIVIAHIVIVMFAHCVTV